MRRRKQLARKASLKPKIVNAHKTARKARTYARVYGSAARAAYVASIPCLMCGRLPSENAHLHTGGMGRKADADAIIPLCASCHRFQHAKGWAMLTGMRDPMPRLLAAAATIDAQFRARYSPEEEDA